MMLIDKYLPSDYSGSVSKRIKTVEPLTPDLIFEEMFCNFPKPVNDSHLTFWVGIYCSLADDGWQDAAVTTVMKFNNFLGKIYFIGIWVFHKLLVKSLFRKQSTNEYLETDCI